MPGTDLDLRCLHVAQVLEQLATLDVNMTYSQARAIQSRAHTQQPELRSTHDALLHQSSSGSSSRLAADSRRQPPDQQHGPCLPGGAAPNRHPEVAAAAAVGAISEMKQWAIDQELGMMEVRSCLATVLYCLPPLMRMPLSHLPAGVTLPRNLRLAAAVLHCTTGS